MKPIVWTAAHEREAWTRGLELAAHAVRAGEQHAAHILASPGLFASTTSERTWRQHLERAGLEPADIAAAVRRVDGLATGRLVREVRWKAAFAWGSVDLSSRADAVDYLAARRAEGGDVVHVRRLRRAR